MGIMSPEAFPDISITAIAATRASELRATLAPFYVGA